MGWQRVYQVIGASPKNSQISAPNASRPERQLRRPNPLADQKGEDPHEGTEQRAGED